MAVWVSLNGQKFALDVAQTPRAKDLRKTVSHHERISSVNIVLTSNGRILEGTDSIDKLGVYHVSSRLAGGKGGFGSLLRAFANQISTSSNNEACRDLTGRRMRDVKKEEQMKEWAVKQAENKEEEQRKKIEKREKILQGPKIEFHDPEFEKASREAVDRVHEAVEQGLKSSQKSDDLNKPSTSGISNKSKAPPKRKVEKSSSACPAPQKKSTLWLGIGIDIDDADLSSDSDSDSLAGNDQINKKILQSPSTASLCGSFMSASVMEQGDKTASA